MKTAIRLVEKGYVPEPLLRRGIRGLLRRRLRAERNRFERDRDEVLRLWIEELRRAPVALVPHKANEQHYELPPAFFQLVLGRHLKYSSAYYPSASTTLDAAEEAMLALTCERARLENGQRVLELGCGWGALTLWMARRYPQSRILAVSNSSLQREHVLAEARRAGLDNVEVLTSDMNVFTTEARFERVVSVEMFEHMRNWEELLRRIARWLQPNGRLFLHVFAHRRYAYPFEELDASDWMGRFFFSGGMMPCHDLVQRLEAPFRSEASWIVSGTHYARTAEDWLCNLERQRPAVLELFRSCYGAEQAGRWYQRWRVFFLACAELFGYRGGAEWLVSHHLLRPQQAGA